MDNRINNNVSFGVRYDLSDRANVFSMRNKMKLRSIAKKLAKHDVVCIGTQEYKTLDIYTGKPFKKRGVRVDYIVGDESSSVRLAQGMIEDKINSQLGEKASNRKKKKLYKKIVFEQVKEILEGLTKIPQKPSRILSNSERYRQFERMHDMKIKVRQWSRLKKTYNKDSWYEKLRNAYYEAKDVSTDNFEAAFRFIW